MKRSLIKDAKPNELVKIQGFVENCRNKRTMCFIVVRDISSKIQVTVDKTAHPEFAEICDKITL